MTRSAPRLITSRGAASAFSHGELTTMNVLTLILLGEREVIYDPAQALQRALSLIPDARGVPIPDSSHEMVSSQHRLVDAHVIDFLIGARARIAA